MEPPLFLFAHGAGAPSSHPWMQRWVKRLTTIGVVSLFDYPYTIERRKRPDPLAKLVAAHAKAQVLRALSTPILFVQGTRDPLCPLNLLGDVRPKMIAPNKLHIVDGGDHSLLVTRSQLKMSGQTQDQVDDSILEAIRRFVYHNTGEPFFERTGS